MNEHDDRPWYRHLWPWLLMIPPAGAVIGGGLTAWLAGGPPALVVDDYSEIALATERRLARDQRAAELGLQAALLLDTAVSQRAIDVRLRLSARADGFEPPERILLKFIHPTHAELDRAGALQRRGQEYAGRLERPPGRLYLQLGDPDGRWRLVGELQPGATCLDLTPGAPP